MNEYCTCGTQLVPRARFCHMCGRTLIEPQIEPEEEAPAIEVAPQAAAIAEAQSQEVSFRNPLAVRPALFCAACATFLVMLPFSGILALMNWLVMMGLAGFMAARMFHRRSGAELTLARGARDGYITGIFASVIMTVLFTINVLVISNERGLSAFYREQLSRSASGAPQMDEMLRLIESPAGLGMTLLFSLAALFLICTLLPMAGGALGAKFSKR